MLKVALIVPLHRWADAMRTMPETIRVIAPEGYEVNVFILPDLGPEFVDFAQYETPEVNLTLRKALGLEPA